VNIDRVQEIAEALGSRLRRGGAVDDQTLRLLTVGTLLHQRLAVQDRDRALASHLFEVLLHSSPAEQAGAAVELLTLGLIEDDSHVGVVVLRREHDPDVDGSTDVAPGGVNDATPCRMTAALLTVETAPTGRRRSTCQPNGKRVATATSFWAAARSTRRPPTTWAATAMVTFWCSSSTRSVTVSARRRTTRGSSATPTTPPTAQH
jgi:hypothetical protein